MKSRQTVKVNTWRVGDRTVTLTVHRHTDGTLCSNCDWDPGQPDEWTDELRAQWMAGLHIAVAATRVAFGQQPAG